MNLSKNKSLLIGLVGGASITVFGLLAILLPNLKIDLSSIAFGSIETGQEYIATTTATMGTGFSVLKSSTGSLGSVIVASSSAATFTVWNATSTTDVASTSPVRFVASPANGTYTFDAVFDRGIIVENPTGANGSYTVTWR